MARYKVLTERCTLGDKNATVSDEDHPGVNFRALVRARHLSLVPDKPAKKPAKKKGDV